MTMRTRARDTRLLVVIPTAGHGGCEYGALSFAADLARNYQSDVWVSFPLNVPLAYMARLSVRNGLHFVPLRTSFPGSDTAQSVQGQERALWDVLELVQPDAVFIPLPWPKRGQGLISAAAAVGMPALVKFALVPETWSAGDFVQPATREAIHERQLWYANSAWSARLLEAHYALPPKSVDSFHVGPIGLRFLDAEAGAERDDARMPRDRRLGIEPEPDGTTLVVTTVARLSVQKGYPHLLDAALDLIAAYPGLRFVWVGDGDLAPDLRARIRDSGAERNFSLLGFRSDVRQILRHSDLFVLPTLYEGGCSQALLEAMEENVPVVVSNTSAVGEVIEHGRNGLLAEPGNADDLRRQLARVIGDARLRRRLATEAARTVQAYSAEAMFGKTRQRIERLIGREIPPRQSRSLLPAARLPSVPLIETATEFLLDLAGTAEIYGLRTLRGGNARPDRLQVLTEIAFAVAGSASPARNIFVAGEWRGPSPCHDRFAIHLDGKPLQVAWKQTGNQWTALADLPPLAAADREAGMTFALTREPAGQGGPDALIRKIAFARSPPGQSDFGTKGQVAPVAVAGSHRLAGV